MISIQLISIVFALLAIFFSYTHYRRNDLNGRELAMWIILWSAFLLIALFPQTISPYIQSLGFSRLMDFVVMVAFVVIFMVLLHNYFVVHRLEHRLEDLVRKLALENRKTSNTSSKPSEREQEGPPSEIR